MSYADGELGRAAANAMYLRWSIANLGQEAHTFRTWYVAWVDAHPDETPMFVDWHAEFHQEAWQNKFSAYSGDEAYHPNRYKRRHAHVA